MMQAEREDLKKAMLEGSKTAFWRLLSAYIDEASSTERFLGIKEEMGMKGYWYLKGYIKGQRDIKRTVEAAARAAESNLKAP